jgi:DNA polymerase-3 subunit delta'
MDSSDFRFAHLLGQDKAKKLLREAVARHKVSHAFLFRGPDGVGKKRAALAYASYMNCKNPGTEDACGQCKSCKKYQSGNHPDLLIVQPDGAAIKIGQIRELIQQLVFPPLEAKYRVIVLEDVHTMKREAANSLLKTLEEPAENNLLILTADQAGEVLPTILSRCQVVPFLPLPFELLSGILQEESNVDDSTAKTLAALSEGSLGRAQLLIKENLLAFRKEIIEQLVELQHGQNESVGAVLLLAEKTVALKENLLEMLDLLRLWFRDLVLFTAGEPETSLVNQDLLHILPTADKRWSIDQLYSRLSMFDRAEKELRQNCNQSLVFEVLFFNLL